MIHLQLCTARWLLSLMTVVASTLHPLRSWKFWFLGSRALFLSLFQATRVFSSAKYPGPSEENKYSSVHRDNESLSKAKRSSYKLQSRHEPVDDKVLKDKLQFYNVHLNLKKSNQGDESSGEGLGRLPKNIPSVSSLLLFNTSENP